MKYRIYQIDTFTNRVFSGNPAAVCPLDDWLHDDLLQKIAMENSLAETAFYVRKDGHYEIRWFTPTMEVDLCGHATLAAAFVLFNFENHRGETIEFQSLRSGRLTVTEEEDLLMMNFPSGALKRTALSRSLLDCFDVAPRAAFRGNTDYLLLFDNEVQVRDAQPSFEHISKLDCRGVIITAEGNEVDFVSRFFAPQCGIYEDPVTGSAHTTLVPYWAKRLNKIEMKAEQLSGRRGYLYGKYLGDRVEISGEGRLYLIGEIYLPTSCSSLTCFRPSIPFLI